MKNPYLNALCAFLYILVIATIMANGSLIFGEKDTAITPVLVLSLFVLSAATMGYLFVAQPLQIYLDGKKQEGVSFFLKTLGTFSLFAFGVLIISALLPLV